MRLSKSG